MAEIPVRKIFYLVASTMKQWCLNRLVRLRKRHVRIFCCVLICLLIPYNFMFYSRGCRHTKVLYNPDRPDTFHHGYPKHLPDHLFPEVSVNTDPAMQALELLASPVPPVVHFVWCDRDYFQFQNYISILAAVKLLKPASIYFHYMQEPELDVDGYYQFYMDLKQMLPNLIQKPLASFSQGCSEDIQTKMDFIVDLLKPDGGIYINENTVITDSLTRHRKEHFNYATHSNTLALVLMSSTFAEQTKPGDVSVVNDKREGGIKFSCASYSQYRKGQDVHCAFVTKQIFPADIFESMDDFGSLARWVAYGRTDLLKPAPANTTVIPNIVHYVWLGDRPFKYFYYLSLLSSLYILNADMVFIHGDIKPKGPYWDKIKSHKRVTFSVRDFPAAIFTEPIVKFASHASDYLRGDVLIRYGGIYMDWDVLWVNPIPNHLRRYETVMCPDFPATGAFPDVFNMGVLLAAQGSHYLRFFLESYHHYLDSHWSYNAIHIPYKVYEKHADLVYVDRHLQVICATGECHPVWVPDFKDPNVHHLSSASFDWRRDTYAMHWTHPDPEEFTSEQSLMDSISLFGSIGKHVLRMAEQRLEKELRR
ncbi:hypothetical protein BaRGS_00018259 [Batillaria attramentaria]|uniref:Glycosyltransferase n=1 Tax=Batillaria attramentaria TaxID=370345 RepID=A0ABD0KU60_9CAEN